MKRASWEDALKELIMLLVAQNLSETEVFTRGTVQIGDKAVPVGICVLPAGKARLDAGGDGGTAPHHGTRIQRFGTRCVLLFHRAIGVAPAYAEERRIRRVYRTAARRDRKAGGGRGSIRAAADIDSDRAA